MRMQQKNQHCETRKKIVQKSCPFIKSKTKNKCIRIKNYFPLSKHH